METQQPSPLFPTPEGHVPTNLAGLWESTVVHPRTGESVLVTTSTRNRRPGEPFGFSVKGTNAETGEPVRFMTRERFLRLV